MILGTRQHLPLLAQVAVPSLVAALLVAGCGGGPAQARAADPRPCLERRGAVVIDTTPDPTFGPTLRFRLPSGTEVEINIPPRGSNVVQVVKWLWVLEPSEDDGALVGGCLA